MHCSQLIHMGMFQVVSNTCQGFLLVMEWLEPVACNNEVKCLLAFRFGSVDPRESQKRLAQPRHSLQSTHSGCFSLFWDVTAIDNVEHHYMLSGGFLIVCFADITHYVDNIIWNLFLPILYLINVVR